MKRIKLDADLSTLLQPESMEALSKIPRGVVNWQSAEFGIQRLEPLLFGLDGMLRYAKAYRFRFQDNLANDTALGPAFKLILKGYRLLLDGDGAAALEADRSTDSKDGAACFEIFEAAMLAAGFEPGDWQ